MSSFKKRLKSAEKEGWTARASSAFPVKSVGKHIL